MVLLRKFPVIFFLSTMVFIQDLSAQDQTTSSWGKRFSIAAKDSTFAMKFGFRAQTLYIGTLDMTSDQYDD